MPFVDLACSTLQRVNYRELDSRPLSMCLLNGQLYIRTQENGLQVFDENLQRIGDHEGEDLGCIYGLTPLLNEALVVASDSGLFHITKQGKI